MKIIALLALTASCGGWSKRDTLLELGFAAVTTQDWRETNSIVQGCREHNPIIGVCGDRVSPNAYFPVALALHAVVSAMLPRGVIRTAWQAAGIGAESATLYGNHNIRWWLTRDPTLTDPTAAR